MFEIFSFSNFQLNKSSFSPIHSNLNFSNAFLEAKFDLSYWDIIQLTSS